MNFTIPSAADMRDIIEQKEMARTKEMLNKQHAEEEKKKHQRDLFVHREVTPEFIERVMIRVRQAAENGDTSILLGRFPSEWCDDHGRKINIAEDGWPETLPGFALKFFSFWERELKPKGFHLSAGIIDFTKEGTPGDVGAYLSWKASEP